MADETPEVQPEVREVQPAFSGYAIVPSKGLKHFFPGVVAKEGDYMCWHGYYRLVDDIARPIVENKGQTERSACNELIKAYPPAILLVPYEFIDEELLSIEGVGDISIFSFWKELGNRMLKEEKTARVFLEYVPSWYSVQVSWRDKEIEVQMNYLKFIPANKAYADFNNLFLNKEQRCKLLHAFEQNEHFDKFIACKIACEFLKYASDNCCMPWKTIEALFRNAKQRNFMNSLVSFMNASTRDDILIRLLSDEVICWNDLPENVQTQEFGELCFANGVTGVPNKCRLKNITTPEEFTSELEKLMARCSFLTAAN
ncbi:hypothetical protein KDA11_01985 [Candidatus Saccharibacteria bacterium]|nr:hypothetical protein [Candidatus Saccharibacteria bacterium]